MTRLVSGCFSKLSQFHEKTSLKKPVSWELRDAYYWAKDHASILGLPLGIALAVLI